MQLAKQVLLSLLLNFMSRSLLFENLTRAMRIAFYCEKNKVPVDQGLEQLAELELRTFHYRASRREFLAIAAAGIGTLAGKTSPLLAEPKPNSTKIGIVGAGLAGLACAYELKKHGIMADLYDASDRVGGRCYSLGGSFAGPVNFPGQVAERGGEFIDSPHRTMLNYARQFGLQLEDVSKHPGEVLYYFNNHYYSELAIVEEFRDLAGAMRADLAKVSGTPTANNYTDADAALDNISLMDYLETRGAGSVLRAALKASYTGEYGLDLEEQSCLNFLLFIHLDKHSKFRPFGIFSDERYHVVDGNQKITEALQNELRGQINLGTRLLRVRKNTMGQIELTFSNGGSQTLDLLYDAVVMAIPFTTLREVELDASLELPDWKLNAIHQLGYGTNSKLIIGFNSRPWATQGGKGTAYADLPNCQTVWETNPSNATTTRAVLTEFSGGQRRTSFHPAEVQAEVDQVLTDLNQIYPGAIAAASRDSNNHVQAHLEHWLSNSAIKGSYTCYKPGQFTTIAGHEGRSIDNLYFAGEHASSFYEWQGFMEGAALSGVHAASAILRKLRGERKWRFGTRIVST